MILHSDISDKELKRLIHTKEICLGGNKKLKIYGTLHCKSGKRMKKENRVFFTSLNDAIENNFRPCAHCMKADYLNWKHGLI